MPRVCAVDPRSRVCESWLVSAREGEREGDKDRAGLLMLYVVASDCLPAPWTNRVYAVDGIREITQRSAARDRLELKKDGREKTSADTDTG